MALRALMLRKKIDDARKALDELCGKDAEFERREAEITQSLDEATTEEEKTAVEEAVTQYDADLSAHKNEKEKLEREIGELEQSLAEEEKRQDTTPPAKTPPATPEKRGMNANMDIRARTNTYGADARTSFYGMNIMERDAFFRDDKVKNFLETVRTCIREKRAIDNVGLTIPDVMLPLLKQITEQTSKLIGRVFLRRVPGTARQVIMGAIPEAVWTEMCASLNELSLSFNDTEVDGFKVGGYFAVCNAILEDNDVNLTAEIINALGKSIGKALDKAIIYGTGTRMPLGIVTRLAQTSQPTSYSATERTWVDLHESHIITGLGSTGVALFQEIVANSQMVINDYFENDITWVMNRQTHAALLMNSMDRNMNAAIVAGMSNTMPVVGGTIVELPFIPNNNIVYGYFDAYLLAERAGTQLGQSEHVRFLEDQTVFKGTARYDGKPVISEAFGVMTITETAPTTSVTFPPDTANTNP